MIAFPASGRGISGKITILLSIKSITQITSPEAIIARTKRVYKTNQHRKEATPLLHHYITRYEEGGRQYVEAWLQINLLGKCWCFSRRRVDVRENEDNVHERLASAMAQVVKAMS